MPGMEGTTEDERSRVITLKTEAPTCVPCVNKGSLVVATSPKPHSLMSLPVPPPPDLPPFESYDCCDYEYCYDYDPTSTVVCEPNPMSTPSWTLELPLGSLPPLPPSSRVHIVVVTPPEPPFYPPVPAPVPQRRFHYYPPYSRPICPSRSHKHLIEAGNYDSDVLATGMKRDPDGEMGPPPKRSRGDTEVRLLIFSKMAGSIIGKGGSNINRLRNDYQANVSLPDSPGPERVLKIEGLQDSVLSILDQIMPMLEAVGGRNRERERTGDSEARLLVHQSQIGCIIGKGGSKVKELRETTGVQIKVHSVCCPRSTDRIVMVAGPAANCVECLKTIINLLKETPVKGPVTQYDPACFDEMNAVEYGGFGDVAAMGGAGGARGGGGGGVGGYSGGAPRSSSSSIRSTSPRGRYGGSSHGGVSHASGGGGSSGGGNPIPLVSGMGRDRSRRHSDDRRRDRDDDDRHGDYRDRGYVDEGYRDYREGGGGMKTLRVTIPKDLAGAIIGKGGQRIRRIRMDSGANITIDEALPNATDRIITISGTDSQIWKAQYMLQQSVRENVKY